MDKKIVKEYYYSESEWDRLGCGPLPPERNQDLIKIPSTPVQPDKEEPLWHPV